MRIAGASDASRSLCRYANGEMKSKYQSAATIVTTRSDRGATPARAARRVSRRRKSDSTLQSRQACASTRRTARFAGRSCIRSCTVTRPPARSLSRTPDCSCRDSILRRERARHARVGRTTEMIGDETAGIAQPVEVDPGFDSEAMQHVHDVLRRNVAGRAFRVRTSAETGNARVERRDAELEARIDIRERLA